MEEKEKRREELAEQVRRAQAGHADGFEALVKLTEDHVRKIAYSVVGPNHSDDVLQESYLLVFRKIQQVHKPEAFMGWLCRLVLHICYRHKKKNPIEGEVPEQVSQTARPEAVLDSIVLSRALDKLRAKDRNLLILRELVGLSYEELSGALQVPVGTVRSRLHKARKRLAECLAAR